jgi:Domain of Unknown Function (DUF1206)
VSVASVRRDSRRVARTRTFRGLVRAGFVARGITYGVIGGLAIAIAVGAGSDGTAPDQQGALALIGRSMVGRVALVVICAGLLAYAIWKLYQGILGRGPEGGGGPGLTDRLGNIGGGVAYLVFFAVAVRILVKGSGGSSGDPRQAARGVLGWPGGPVIVGIAGAALVAISCYQLYDALSGAFAKESKTSQMDPRARDVFLTIGRIGLSARALVFVLIGYFLVRTAIEFKASQAIGVDGALARLHHQPLGAVLLLLVAAGLLTFATFSLLEARYRRL